MNDKISIMKNPAYPALLQQIGQLLQSGREKVAYTVNNILVQTYWQIGQYIVEYEQNGNEKSIFGSKLIDSLSADLTMAYGKGFSRSNLMYMRKFYLRFPISETLSHQLTWSHYLEILKADNELEIGFYTKQTEIEKWSVNLMQQI